MKASQKQWQSSGVRVHLVYSNGISYYKDFENKDDALKFIHNEGDHLIDYEMKNY